MIYRIHSASQGYYRYCLYGIPYFKDSVHGSYYTADKELAKQILKQLKLICPQDYRLALVPFNAKQVTGEITP